MTITTLEAARKYVAMGYSVLPIYHPANDPAPKGKRGKKPAVAWKEYQTRLPTDEELVSWFDGKDMNVGIITGKLSGVDVVDLDSEEAISLALERGLELEPNVRTQRGIHVYCKNSGRGNFQKRDDLPDIDFRGEGGYVVAPPSVHESGHVYKWSNRTAELPECPAWLFPTEENKVQTKKSFTELYAGVESGDRNQTLARLCGVWALNLDYPTMLEAAETWNDKNSPKMDADEVETTVRSIFLKEKSKTKGSKAEEVIELKESEIVSLPALRSNLGELYKTGLQRGESTGWACLDEYYTVRRGEWTLVTGIPGCGKTEFLDHLMINLSLKDWKFGIFSAENLPHERHTISLIEKYLNKPFSIGPTPRATQDEVNRALDYLQERFFFLAPDENNMTIERILKLGAVMLAKHNISGMVIDPWNELDHSRVPGMTETEFVSSCLTKVRRFARQNRIHVWVVAHPTKLQKNKENGKYPVPTPYDVSGSAHWRNKADNALSLWRDTTIPSEPTDIHVQKIRFREVGKIGMAKLKYDVVSGRFIDESGPADIFFNKQGGF